MDDTVKLHLDESSLTELFNDNLATTGSVGVDGVSIKKFEENLSASIEVISRKVGNGTYDFSLYKEKLIAKGRYSAPRVISIPTNRDKLLLKALHNFIGQSFADLPQEGSIHSKIVDIKKQVNAGKYDSFIKLDVKDFFLSIRHDLLLEILSQNIADEVALDLIEKAVTQSTVAVHDEDRGKYKNKIGVPQGLSISSLLASIFLLPFDRKHEDHPNYRYFRFVDDILILCRKEEIHSITHDIKNDMEEIGLQLHDFSSNIQKSSYGSIADGFQFLGYLFTGNRISVRPSSLDKIYRGINRIFARHYKYAEEEDLNELYFRLNLKITGCVVDDKRYGWLFFFSHINDQKLLFKLDAHVKRACKRFDVPYDSEEIKKFSRTYYELAKGEKSNYIPCYSNKTIDLDIDGLLKLAGGLEKKKTSSCKIIQFKDAKKKIVSAELHRIEPSILADIEKDIEFY